jgi:hypothetical protein
MNCKSFQDVIVKKVYIRDRSPDGAKRNPGLFSRTPFPDFAEPVIGPATSGRTRWLHPGYK